MGNNLQNNRPTHLASPRTETAKKTSEEISSKKKPPEEILLGICRQQMSKGSVSFYTAARLLPADQRAAIFLLYGWCRAMDDLTDGQNLGHRDLPTEVLDAPFGGKQDAPSPEELLRRGKTLNQVANDLQRIMTDRSWYREKLSDLLRSQTSQPENPGRKKPPSPSSLAQGDWPLVAMGYLAHEKGLHPFYAQELLKGMAMDLSPPHYQTLQDLKSYCYHVAGVVGVMYSDIVGLRDDRAKKYASDLGIAMQLTNICRDILDDAAIGRIYLPRSMMEHYGIPFDPRELGGYKEALAELTDELLQHADVLYARASKGFCDLPWRAALAASAACAIYREIGVKVRRRKSHAWDVRCRVGGLRKIILLCRSLGPILRDIPFRWRHPWQRSIPQNTWRFDP
jgi:phytoene synthase